MMIQSSASFLGRFLASAGSVFSSLTLEANMKICIVTQYKVHQCMLMPTLIEGFSSVTFLLET